MPKQPIGLHRKFHVCRYDGRDRPGGDRYGATYFVLDVTHDRHAMPALAAYAQSCMLDYPLLAEDMAKQYGINTVAQADNIATLREQNAALVAALKTIGDQTSHAGDEFGGPLAVAMKEGLGTRDELLDLAGIAGGYLESISLTAKQALASVKGDK